MRLRVLTLTTLSVLLIAFLIWNSRILEIDENLIVPTIVPTPTEHNNPIENASSTPVELITQVAATNVEELVIEVPPSPTARATRTATPFIEPSESQTTVPIQPVTAKPSQTIAIVQDSIDRTCPEPPPGKPDYRHYYLSGQQWSTPESSANDHFWLSNPLPGGGRLLITEWLPYGYDASGRYLLHNGIDMAEPLGTPLLSAADGMVVVAGGDESALYGWRCDWYGQLVVVELNDRWQGQPVYVLYGHVLNIGVQPGEQVVRGQQLAEVGVGGAATLPHLHLEVRVGTNEFESSRNPLLWFNSPNSRGLIVGRLVDPDGRPWQGVAVNAIGRSDKTEDRTTWTYLDDALHTVNPDEQWAENFVFGDVKPGEYELYIQLQGSVYKELIEVDGGQISFAEIITEQFKTPTPTAITEGLKPSPTVGAETTPS